MLIYLARDEFGQRCEVRKAGKSLRLYTDGTFHSQFNPARLIENNLWDLLWLPVLAAPLPPRRVLVLGVGGGAVLGKLRRLAPQALLVGVDISAMHLTIARRVFKVGGRNCLLLQADALGFVKHYQGPGFDLIIDDLFASNRGEPERVVAFEPPWLAALSRLLTARGQVVANLGSEREFWRAAQAVSRRGDFLSRVCLAHRQYENVIGSFSRLPSPFAGGCARACLETRLRALGAGALPAAIGVKDY